MTGIDTNVLVRFLTALHPAHTKTPAAGKPGSGRV